MFMKKDAYKRSAMQKVRELWQSCYKWHSSEVVKLSDLEVREAIKAILKTEKLITSWIARRTASLEDSATLSGQKEIWERY